MPILPWVAQPQYGSEPGIVRVSQGPWRVFVLPFAFGSHRHLTRRKDPVDTE